MRAMRHGVIGRAWCRLSHAGLLRHSGSYLLASPPRVGRKQVESPSSQTQASSRLPFRYGVMQAACAETANAGNHPNAAMACDNSALATKLLAGGWNAADNTALQAALKKTASDPGVYGAGA